MKPFPSALIIQFVKRELLAKFRGSILGILWVVLLPVLMLAIFTLVFHGIFGMKWSNNPSVSALEFSLYLFVGLGVYQFASEVLNRATTLIIAQTNLVTKVVFPLWILPLVSTLVAAINWLVSFVLLLLLALWVQGVDWHWLLLPLIVLPLFIALLGVSLLFSSIGVYLRDLPHLVSMTMMGLMFLSPIFYPLSAVPESWQFWFTLNPLTQFIEPLRSLLLEKTMPSLTTWITIYGIAIGCFTFGKWVFLRLQKGFADVL